MWTRKKLKTKAKKFLSLYLILSILVTFTFYFLNILLSSTINFLTIMSGETSPINGMLSNPYLKLISPQNLIGQLLDKFSNTIFLNFNDFFVNFTGFITILIFIIAILGVLFILALRIGLCRYFLMGYKTAPLFSILFSPFKEKKWLSLSLKLLLKGIYIFLFFLLFILPGIYKSYQYRFVEYILAENPNLSLHDSIHLSKKMTENQKFNIFILDISFLGWIVLSNMTFGIGYLLLNPYMEATYAALYLDIKENLNMEINENVREEQN